MTSLIGFTAGALTTLSFVPQVVRTLRTRRCDDLSGAMLAIFTTGVGLWLAYGLAARSVPIIAANAVTLVLLLAMIAMKIAFGRQRHSCLADRREPVPNP